MQPSLCSSIISKSFLLLGIFIISSSNINAQTWTQQQSLPTNEERYNAIAFSVMDKGYLALGRASSSTYNDVWEYNPANNTWTQKNNFIGNARFDAIAVTTDSFAYAGLGFDGSSTYYDLYEYNPISDSWTQKTGYPGDGGRNCFAASANEKIYVGGGTNAAVTPYDKDFWEYDCTTDSWTQLTDFPFGPRATGIAFSINNIIYFGLGHDDTNDFSDLWAYNPSTSQWNQMASLPGIGRNQATCFIFNGKAIVGGGKTLSGSQLSDYYEYNPQTNSWTSISSFANGSRSNSRAFYTSQAGYICTGLNSGSELRDLWKYTFGVGIEDNASINNFNLYPIPNSGQIFIDYEAKDNFVVFKLFNSLGKEVLFRKISGQKNKLTIDVSYLDAGNYYYQFSSSKGITSGKIPLIK